MVAEDYNFDSAQPVKSLEDTSRVLIFVIEQVSHMFPMAHLQRRYFTCGGGFYGSVSEDSNEGVTDMMAFSWVSHNS